jgi:hypothetical protein
MGGKQRWRWSTALVKLVGEAEELGAAELRAGAQEEEPRLPSSRPATGELVDVQEQLTCCKDHASQIDLVHRGSITVSFFFFFSLWFSSCTSCTLFLWQ